jgi:hypothetical protein
MINLIDTAVILGVISIGINFILEHEEKLKEDYTPYY